MIQSFRLFVAAYETRSFTQAAKRENATQSGVSQHVRNLEERHGVQLFQRERGRILPTPAADSFYRHCLAALRSVDDALGAVGAFASGVTGDVVVGVMPTVSAGALAPALLSFRARHPNARVHVIEAYSDALTRMVIADEVDFAVLPAMPALDGVRIRPFFVTGEALVSRRGDAADEAAPIKMADLQSLRLVMPEAGNTRAETIRAYLAVHSVEISEALELNSMMATLDLIARSDWKAILPMLMMAAYSRHPDLVATLLDPRLPLELVIVEPARRATSSASASLQSAMREACETLESSGKASISR